MQITQFDDYSAKSKTDLSLSHDDLVEYVTDPPEYESKEKCGWIKLAAFGDVKTDKGSYRHDANVISISGCEGDYDGMKMPIKTAAAVLEAANIKAILHTSPSYTPEAPKWRVLLPLSHQYEGTPDELKAIRTQMLKRVDRILGDVFAPESYTLSQSYYIGQVLGKEYECIHVDGDYIDQRDDLQVEILKDKNGNIPASGEKFDFEKTVNRIYSEENYHQSLISLASHFIGIATAPHKTKTIIRAIFDASPNKGHKWQARYDYIDDAVDSAFKKFGVSEVKVGYDLPEDKKTVDPFDWVGSFTLSQEDADKISDPEWIVENLIIQGHVIAIVAEPNGGKTTVLTHLSAQMARDGYNVYYVNADISGGDAKSLVATAREDGYQLLLPDMIAGLSMDDVVTKLVQLNELGGDYYDRVFIFDTLKKMTDVISKSKAKELYKLLRGLSAKGMTIILLAHTNKYKDSDGNPIFEGTADLRSDLDELIYLIPEKQPDGSMIVSTKPDKVRGKFKPISFEISPDRDVKQLSEFVDTESHIQHAVQMDKDATVIEAITEAIQAGQFKQKQIVDYCKSSGIGWRTSETVLKRYREDNPDGYPVKWKRERAFEKNAWVYTLIRSRISGGESENW